MKRLILLAAAFAALLAFAPAAFAAPGVTYTVNDNGDLPDANTSDGICDTGVDPVVQHCTLRAAIEQSNATTGLTDTINFGSTGNAPAPAGALPAVTDPVSVNGGGNTTVTFAGAATGNLLDIQAANSVVKSIAFTGGDAAATVLNLGASGDQLGAVTVQNAPGRAVRLGGGSERVDGSTISSTGSGIRVDAGSATIASSTVTNSGGAGIDIHGNAAVVSSPTITGSAGNGITAAASSARITGGSIHGNGGDGVAVTGTLNVVSGVVFYANGGKPIAVAPGANGAVQPPQNLRIGPRRADGSLPLTGETSAGQLELWSGDPSGATPPGFVAGFRVSGQFAYNFPSEPQPGHVFAASITADGAGSSEFATVRVPDDISSPDITTVRALDTNNVLVEFTEPIDPNSVQAGDFHLNMAGQDRQISGVTVAPDGRSLTLASGGWQAGEAGLLDVTAPGAVNDSAGNAMITTPHLRVAAAPGDFIAPLGGSLRVTPRTICLTRARKCRRPGMVIRFTTTEAGKATILIKRSNKTLGKRTYGNIVPGLNTLKFNGRLGSRKLRAGRYRLLVYVQDRVGNVTAEPPITLFSVRRVTR